MKCGRTASSVLIALMASLASSQGSNIGVEAKLAALPDASIFYHALLNTGVANELSESVGYSVFAPMNAAFSPINPNTYPCFYAVQCRAQVAAILRNHIVPQNYDLASLSFWQGIPTLGNRYISVEEPYIGQFAVDGRRIVYALQDVDSSVYEIAGLLADNAELRAFVQAPGRPGTLTGRLTGYRTIIVPEGPMYPVPGGVGAPVITEIPEGPTTTIIEPDEP